MAGESMVLDRIVENINTINATTREIASLVAGASDEERAGVVRALDFVHAIVGLDAALVPATDTELDRIMNQFGGVLGGLAPHDREGSDVVGALALFGAQVVWQGWLRTGAIGGFVSVPGGALDRLAALAGLMHDEDLAPCPYVSDMVRHLLGLDKP